MNTMASLYDSATPEVYDRPLYKKNRDAFQYLRDVVDRNVDQDEAVERAKKKIDELLDSSILGKGDLTQEPKIEYIIEPSKQIDLSKLNFAVLRAQFSKKEYKNIQFADLRELLEIKLKQMLAQNKTRGGFLVDFQKIIDDYNSGSISIDKAYEQLLNQAQAMDEEARRAAKNEMTEAEQELFDLLKKEKLTKEEEKSVRLAAHILLEKLFDAKNKILIQEWWKEKSTQGKVKREIQLVLAKLLPKNSYDRVIFSEKVDVAFQHFYELAELGRGVAA